MMKDLSVLDNLIVGRVEPHIYAFTTNTVPNYLKVGDTYRPVSVRLKEWKQVYPELQPQFEDKAKVADDVYFRDYSVHRFLETDKGMKRLLSDDLPEGVYYSNEFFRDASAVDVGQAISDINEDFKNKTNKYQFYNVQTHLPATMRYASTGIWKPRPNQQTTIDAFKAAVDNGRTHLLMYAVMRFGKSFTSMCCAAAMDAKLVVVVSAKADVMDEWKKTVESAENFSEYEFLSPNDLRNNYKVISQTVDNPDNPKKVVVFLTLQDLRGTDIKEKHQQIFNRKVDLLIVDETHFGARAEKYGAILRDVKDVKEKISAEEAYTIEDAMEEVKSLDVGVTLHLSGTPYRILMGGEFAKEDIIAFYQFTDIVKEQEAWDSENLMSDDVREWDNPYYGFPQMVRFAFHPNESARKRLEELQGNGTAYAFSALFRPQSVKRVACGSHKKFVFEREILDFLEVVDGSREDGELLGFLDYPKIKEGKMCRHIVCVLPYCASCDALETLIKGNPGKFKNLNDYEIINISGVDNQNMYKSPKDIKKRIRDCEEEGKKTLTLTVNRMLTGSTVEQWDTMLYLKDTSSPQEYDRAIFRLQNQYIKTYVNENGEIIKYNMKPQTLLVDFDPNRVFVMQEQKAQIYNVNVDEAGNSKLSERIAEELRISPVIVMNRNKIRQIEAADILGAVSEYSRNRGVAEETLEIPVDMSLMSIDVIREAIERENELGSKSGLTINGADDEGDDFDFSELPKEPNTMNKPAGAEEPTTLNETEETENNNKKDVAKQFRSYYARILFLAFLTKDVVISLSDIIDCINEPDNARIAYNLGIKKSVLECVNNNSDKFMLRKLDYKIQNLNQLSHDDSLNSVARAYVAVQKFGKLGESEVITPKRVCKDMADLIPEDGFKAVIDNGHKILDIAGKAGEFALAICERYAELGYNIDEVRNSIYTIPTSGLTYEFTRMIYEILGLNTDNIAAKFTSYDMLNVYDEETEIIDYTKIIGLLTQDKLFRTISMTDEIATEGDDKVNFDVVIGNPPYHEIISKTETNKSLGKELFPLFMRLSTKCSQQYASLITPSKWFTGDGQDRSFPPLRDFYKQNRHFSKYYHFGNGEAIFPDVSVGSISYFLYDKNYVGNVEFHNCGLNNTVMERPLFEEDFDIILSINEMVDIIKKVTNFNGFTSLKEITFGRNAFGILGKDAESESVSKAAEFEGSVEVRCKYEKLRYITPDKITKNISLINKWKVFISKGNGAAGTLSDGGSVAIIGKAYIGQPGSACSDSLFPIGPFDTQEEAINLQKYFATKFLRFMVGIMKVSRNITQLVYKYVPMQDFTGDSDIDWSKSIEEIDNRLYLKYGLSQEEINYIESMIKPME